MRVPVESLHCCLTSRGGGLNLIIERNSRGHATIPKDPDVPVHSRYTWFPVTDSTVTPCSDSQHDGTCDSLPGARVRNPAHCEGHEEGILTYAKGVIWFQGYPLDFPAHLPPKTRVCLHYCTVHSTLLTLTGAVLHHLSLENFNSELQLVSCIWTECFSSNPSDGSLTCLRGSSELLQVVIVYSPPTTRGTKLKAS